MLFRHDHEKLMPSLTPELSVYFRDLPCAVFFVISALFGCLQLMNALFECFQLVLSQQIHFQTQQ